MALVRGTVVKSTAGHDGGSFYVALSLENGFAMIADGKLRTLEKPKKKNLKHLAATNVVLTAAQLETNKKIRRALWPYNYGGSPPLSDLNGR